MERIGRLAGKLKVNTGSVSPEDIARAAWPVAVGKTVAARTNAAKLVRGTLIIQVEDAVWQRQLNRMRHQIIHRVHEVSGSAAVEDLAFEPMTPKRGPDRAVTARAESATMLSLDDADKIHDATLRRVYKISRKKATA